MSDIADLLAPPTEASVEREVAAYVDAVACAYGPRLVGVFMFGSRARGDHRPESDVDLAVVLTTLEGGAVAEKMRLIDLGFDALTDAGVMIQPWPFTQTEWDGDGQGSRFADLLRNARRDAVRLMARS